MPVGGGIWPQQESRPRKLRMGPDVEGVGLRGQRSGPRNLGPGQGSPRWTPSSASLVRRQTRASHGTRLPRASVGRLQCAPRASLHFGGSPHWDGPRGPAQPSGRPHPFPSAKWGSEAEDGLERWWQVSLSRGGPSPWPLSPSHTSRDPSLSPASVAGCVDADTPRWVGECSRFAAPLRTAGAHRRQQDTRLAQGPLGSLPPEPEPCGTTGHPQAKSSLTPAALCGRLRAAPWAAAGGEGRPPGPVLWGLGTCAFAILDERALLPDQTGMDPRRAAAILWARPCCLRDTPPPPRGRRFLLSLNPFGLRVTTIPRPPPPVAHRPWP